VLVAHVSFEALESLFVRSENRKVDIDHERSIRIVDGRVVSRHHDQVTHALHSSRINAVACEKFHRPRCTLRLGLFGARRVNGVMEPESKLDLIRLLRQMPNLVELQKAIVDVLARVIVTMLLSVRLL
jgi:hypothetical protein